MSEQFVELVDRGVTLCTDRAGDGSPLLIINGTRSDLRNQPNALKWPIARHFDVLTYDHRGLGRSEQHDDSYQPTMADFAADALALCDSQGIDEFSVIGVSFGGMVAQELAMIAGTRLKKLVLCCTSSGGEGGASYPLHDLFERGQTLDDIFGMWDIRAQYDRAFAEELLKILEDREERDDPPGFPKQIEARRHHDTWHRLQLILAETMVAHGVYDGVAPPENSERLADRIPRSKLASFVGGHFFLWQDEHAWPSIISFLEEGRTAA